MQGTQYATKRSILCRGAFCGPTAHTFKEFACFLYSFSSMIPDYFLVIDRPSLRNVSF